MQVLYAGNSGPEGEKAKEGKDRTPRNRPDLVYGFTQKVLTGHGTMYVTINEVDGKPFELFATIGKSGRSTTAKAEAIGRLVSLALRSGIPVEEIVQQIKGIGGDVPVFQSGKQGQIQSIPDAIGWVLENRYLKSKLSIHDAGGLGTLRCQECDEPLIFQEGCYICPNCAFTKCG